jgi:cysteine desulfurase/selenocysteine lyase
MANAEILNSINVELVRKDFPILKRKVHGKQLVYLVSAETSQKPACVIGVINYYYRIHNANIHRGL